MGKKYQKEVGFSRLRVFKKGSFLSSILSPKDRGYFPANPEILPVFTTTTTTTTIDSTLYIYIYIVKKSLRINDLGVRKVTLCLLGKFKNQ